MGLWGLPFSSLELLSCSPNLRCWPVSASASKPGLTPSQPGGWCRSWGSGVQGSSILHTCLRGHSAGVLVPPGASQPSCPSLFLIHSIPGFLGLGLIRSGGGNGQLCQMPPDTGLCSAFDPFETEKNLALECTLSHTGTHHRVLTGVSAI